MLYDINMWIWIVDKKNHHFLFLGNPRFHLHAAMGQKFSLGTTKFFNWRL